MLKRLKVYWQLLQIEAGGQDERSQRIRQLGRLGHEAAIKPLIRFLDDEQRRAEAASALAQMQVHSALPAILEAAGQSTPETRLKLIISAIELRDTGSLKTVEQLLDEGVATNEVTGSRLVSALGAMKGPVAASILVRFARHDLSTVRMEVASALVSNGATDMDSVFESLAADPNRFVIKATLRALAKSDGDFAQAVRRAEQAIKSQGFGALRSTGTAAIGPLLNQLDDSRYQIFCFRELGRLGDPRVVPHLVRYLSAENAQGHADLEVRSAASHAIQDIGPPAVERLKKALPNADGPAARAIDHILRVIQVRESQSRS